MKYFYGNKKHEHNVYEVNTLEKIETVIREISFSNNYYGSFFVNSISATEDYSKKVGSLQKQLNLMHAFRGFMKFINFIPKDAKVMLRNVKPSYPGLIEAGVDFDNSILGGKKNYSDLLQALLTALTKTSKIEYQDFFHLKKPDMDIGMNHNSEVLVRVVELGLGTLMQQFFIEQQKQNGFFHSEDFKKIDENLFTLISPKAAHSLIDKLEPILLKNGKFKEKYKVALGKLFADNVKLQGLKPFAWNMLLLTIDLGFESGELDKLIDLLPVLIQNMDSISEIASNQNLNAIFEKSAGLIEFLREKIKTDEELREKIKEDIRFFISKIDELIPVINELFKSKSTADLQGIINFIARLIDKLDNSDKEFLITLIKDAINQGALSSTQQKFIDELMEGGDTFIAMLKYLDFRISHGQSDIIDLVRSLLLDKKDHMKELFRLIEHSAFIQE
jgi:hypothetical protein